MTLTEPRTVAPGKAVALIVDVVRSVVLIMLYVVAGFLGLVIANADQDNVMVLYGLVAAASLALGWGTGRWVAALAPGMLILLGLFFGRTDKFTGGDDTDPVALLALVAAVLSAAVILSAVGSRRLYERRRAGSTHG